MRFLCSSYLIKAYWEFYYWQHNNFTNPLLFCTVTVQNRACSWSSIAYCACIYVTPWRLCCRVPSDQQKIVPNLFPRDNEMKRNATSGEKFEISNCKRRESSRLSDTNNTAQESRHNKIHQSGAEQFDSQGYTSQTWSQTADWILSRTGFQGCTQPLHTNQQKLLCRLVSLKENFPRGQVLGACQLHVFELPGIGHWGSVRFQVFWHDMLMTSLCFPWKVFNWKKKTNKRSSWCHHQQNNGFVNVISGISKYYFLSLQKPKMWLSSVFPYITSLTQSEQQLQHTAQTRHWCPQSVSWSKIRILLGPWSSEL